MSSLSTYAGRVDTAGRTSDLAELINAVRLEEAALVESGDVGISTAMQRRLNALTQAAQTLRGTGDAPARATALDAVIAAGDRYRQALAVFLAASADQTERGRRLDQGTTRLKVSAVAIAAEQQSRFATLSATAAAGDRALTGRMTGAELSGQLATQVLQTRRREAEYLRSQARADGDAVAQHIQEMFTQALRLRKHLPEAEAAAVHEVAGSISAYRTQFIALGTAFSDLQAAESRQRERQTIMAEAADQLAAVVRQIETQSAGGAGAPAATAPAGADGAAGTAVGAPTPADSDGADARQTAARRQANAAAAREILRQVLLARLAEKSFLLTGAEEAAGQARAAIRALFTGAIALKRQLDDEAGRALFSQLSAAAQTYRVAFGELTDDAAARRQAVARSEEVAAALTAQATLVQDRILAIRDRQLQQYQTLRAEAAQARAGFERAAALRDAALGLAAGGQTARLILTEHLLNGGNNGGNDALNGGNDALAAMQGTIREAMAQAEAIAALVDAQAERAVVAGIRTAAGAIGSEFAGAVAARDRQHQARADMAAAAREVSDRIAAEVASQVAEREAGHRRAILALIFGTLGAVAIGALFAWAITRSITHPLRAITAATTRLSEDDLTVNIPGAERRDETGALARAVAVFKANQIRLQEVWDQQTRAHRVREHRTMALERLAAEFDRQVGAAVSGVATAAGGLETTAGAMSAVADQAARQTKSVAAASAQTSGSVQTVAVAADQLAAAISEIGQQISESARISGRATAASGRADALVVGLSDSTQKINEIVALIHSIASQTNLLALNATIEAARAGEAGKGFAVVAGEVKSLAAQTARATESITAQIAAVQGAARTAAEAIREIGQIITEINEVGSIISAAVEEQGTVTNAIARNAQEAAAGTTEVSRTIGGLTQGAGETGQAAHLVLGAAAGLSTQARDLRQSVDEFLTTLRAIGASNLADLLDTRCRSRFMSWSNDLSVGDPDIDNDHMIFIGLVNTLHDAAENGQAAGQVASTLNQLLAYVHTHFHNEEMAMQASGYPGYADHKQRHETLTTQVIALQKQHAAKGPAVLEALMVLLKERFVEHIRQCDLPMGQYLIRQRPAAA